MTVTAAVGAGNYHRPYVFLDAFFEGVVRLCYVIFLEGSLVVLTGFGVLSDQGGLALIVLVFFRFFVHFLRIPLAVIISDPVIILLILPEHSPRMLIIVILHIIQILLHISNIASIIRSDYIGAFVRMRARNTTERGGVIVRGV